MNTALILAGGTGSRFLSRKPKQFVGLGAKPLICHVIEACRLSRSVEAILVVCHRDYIEELHTILASPGVSGGKALDIIAGGTSRIKSTLLGLAHINQAANDTVVLLESNRPLVTAVHIDMLYQESLREGTACAFYYSRIKESLFCITKDGGEGEWLDRSNYGVSQTPYLLNYDAGRDILKHMQGRDCSDSMDILSFLSPSIKKIAVEAHFNNIKITQPEDLLFAESLMENRHEKS